MFQAGGLRRGGAYEVEAVGDLYGAAEGRCEDPAAGTWRPDMSAGRLAHDGACVQAGQPFSQPCLLQESR
jgi:hypothetical protein